jgi:hypothetical protein
VQDVEALAGLLPSGSENQSVNWACAAGANMAVQRVSQAARVRVAWQVRCSTSCSIAGRIAAGAWTAGGPK